MDIKFYLTLCTALLLAACNPFSQVGESDERIERFHASFNAGDYVGLYDQTGSDFKASLNRQQAVELFGNLAERMGKLETTQRAGFDVRTNDGVTKTTITMNSTYTNGEALETFYFVGSGEEMSLQGWRINSDLLVQAPLVATENEAEPAN